MQLPETVAANLALWQDSLLRDHELCLLELTALGKKMGAEHQTEDAASLSPLTLPHLTAPDGEQAPAQALLRVVGVAGQVAFCRGFVSTSPHYQEMGEQSTDKLPCPRAPRVVFWDNQFARAALHRFKNLLPLARPVTVPSLGQVCEELAAGNADFALLPLGDSKEGRLQPLYDAIDRFELRISHTCDIPYPSEGRSMCFALIAGQYDTPPAKLRAVKLLGCEVLEQDRHTLSDLLSAAAQCDLSLQRIDSLPSPYGEDTMLYQPTFRVEGDERVFECYLDMCHLRARVIGKYQHLLS